MLFETKILYLKLNKKLMVSGFIGLFCNYSRERDKEREEKYHTEILIHAFVSLNWSLPKQVSNSGT